MRYFTAALGESHHLVARALVRSFQRFEPDASLTVFTDLDAGFPNAERTSLESLLKHRERFYRRPGRRNVFKFTLFKEMFRRYPGEPIGWIDADTLLLSDLSRRLEPTKINVTSHGRRDAETVALGNRLEVPGSRYAISGFFSLPDPSWLDRLERITEQRPAWDHRDHNSNLGDQLILNHVIASSDPDEVNWLTDDCQHVYNLEIAEEVHPVVGDQRLRSLTRSGDAVYLGDRRIVLFYWIKKQFDLHLADEFRTFQPEVRSLLASLYSGDDERASKGPWYSRVASRVRA